MIHVYAYLQITYFLKGILPEEISADKYFESCDFSRENTNIVNNRWTIVRFTHSQTYFILGLSRRIFSVSINSHPDNIYVLVC